MEATYNKYKFGPHEIDGRQVFRTTPLSFVIVNLRPVRPDVLVCPRREVKRFVDLSPDETCDLWMTAKEVGARLEQYHKASSLTFTIQDGPHSGQTVPHVHIHIVPRKKSDFENNDDIYDAINVKEKELKEALDLDIERKDRTMEEMAQEANEHGVLLQQMIKVGHMNYSLDCSALGTSPSPRDNISKSPFLWEGFVPILFSVLRRKPQNSTTETTVSAELPEV